MSDILNSLPLIDILTMAKHGIRFIVGDGEIKDVDLTEAE